MTNTTLYSASLLLSYGILYNFLQTSAHLATTVASNNFLATKEMVLSWPKFLANPPLCFYLMRFSLIEILGIQNWLSLNNIPSWIMKFNHFILSNTIGTIQAFQASTKLGSSWYKFMSSLNPTTLIYILVSKRCLLLSTSATLLDF